MLGRRFRAGTKAAPQLKQWLSSVLIFMVFSFSLPFRALMWWALASHRPSRNGSWPGVGAAVVARSVPGSGVIVCPNITVYRQPCQEKKYRKSALTQKQKIGRLSCMEKYFEKLKSYYGTHKAAAAALCVSYTQYNEWRWRPDKMPTRSKLLVELAAAKPPKKSKAA